ncbi:MAG: exodeoxyribonuclease VII small subunit [Alistipes sp.]|nr:exodeoxyribonuclease VII small subunit [Alistipes sp.]
MKTSKTELSYADAIAEIEQILSQLHAEKISVDELEQKVKRATELIEHCRAKLSSVESGVSALLNVEE